MCRSVYGLHGGLKPDAKWERPLLASGHVSDWPKDVSGKVKGQLPEKSPSFVLHGSSTHVALITATVLLGE